MPLRGKILNVERARFDKMLSSQEIGNLVTALGCGIGKQEFDVEKLRYHSIVIMTDADVDGSHIRTLLLTFFFRQMPELLERGHVFIAQPPLYKVKKNRQERYVKDDDELNGYFLELALQDAQLFVNPEAPGIQGEALESLVADFQRLLDDLAPSNRKYPPDVTHALLRVPSLDDAMLNNESEMRAWAQSLKEVLDEDASKAPVVEISLDNELNVYLPTVSILLKGSRKNIVLSKKFIDGFEYQQIKDMRGRLENLLEEGAYVQRGERSAKVKHFAEAFEWLQSEARRGVDIQRYKGLGEMNPEQLWETTMDQSVRRMLQVTVDDAIGADQMFTTLMGDQVEPRRDFIETNALSVVNLDV